MTLADITTKIRSGNLSEGEIRSLRIDCHPDRHPHEEALAASLFAQLGTMADALRAPPTLLRSPTAIYTLGRLVAAGDVADIHEAEAGANHFLIKSSRIAEGAKLLKNEAKILAELRKNSENRVWNYYLPELIESFAIRDGFAKQINVFARDEGWYSLEEVKKKYRGGLDGRHIAWVGKRLLGMLGFLAEQGIVHGALLPPHILVHPATHALRLVGWGQGVKSGSPILAGVPAYLDWYPAEVRKKQGAVATTDSYMAARSMIWLADAKTPVALVRFWRGLLMESPGMRPADPHPLHQELSELVGKLCGTPSFIGLEM